MRFENTPLGLGRRDDIPVYVCWLGVKPLAPEKGVRAPCVAMPTHTSALHYLLMAHKVCLLFRHTVDFVLMLVAAQLMLFCCQKYKQLDCNSSIPLQLITFQHETTIHLNANR